MSEQSGQLTRTVDLIEAKKRSAPNGQPVWYARDLMEVLDYKDWTNFRNVIDRAIAAADNSGVFSTNHFREFTEEVEAGSGAKGKRENWVLSKYACYLVTMNSDVSKPEVATAQSYFVVQTQKQQEQEALSEEERRLLLRNRVKDANKKLSSAALDAGVRNTMFGVFHDAGYRGLYGGKGMKEIKRHKGIADNDDLLDCVGRAELAANEFRITQTEEKLRKESIRGEQTAIDTHHAVGAKVRQTIKELRGTMPEELPAAPSIKKLATKQAREAKKLKEGKA